MFCFALSVALLALALGSAPAQASEQPTVTAAPDPKLIAHLREWEKAMKEVDSFAVEGTLV